MFISKWMDHWLNCNCPSHSHSLLWRQSTVVLVQQIPINASLSTTALTNYHTWGLRTTKIEHLHFYSSIQFNIGPRSKGVHKAAFLSGGSEESNFWQLPKHRRHRDCMVWSLFSIFNNNFTFFWYSFIYYVSLASCLLFEELQWALLDNLYLKMIWIPNLILLILRSSTFMNLRNEDEDHMGWEVILSSSSSWAT